MIISRLISNDLQNFFLSVHGPLKDMSSVNIDTTPSLPLPLVFKMLFTLSIVVPILLAADTPTNGLNGPACDVYARCLVDANSNWRDGTCVSLANSGANSTYIRMCSCIYYNELSYRLTNSANAQCSAIWIQPYRHSIILTLLLLYQSAARWAGLLPFSQQLPGHQLRLSWQVAPSRVLPPRPLLRVLLPLLKIQRAELKRWAWLRALLPLYLQWFRLDYCKNA